MAFVLTDGTTTVSFEPTYGYKNKQKQLVNRHEVRDGGMYQYQFSNPKAWNLPLIYVSSANAETLNGWWRAGTELSVTPHGSVEVTTVGIINKEAPISQNIKPSDTEFKGRIDLRQF
jgi:hypothetical protein